MACGSIDRGSSADCDNLPPGGTRARFIVANFDDITGWTESTLDQRITAFTMTAGTSAYEFTGFRNDMKISDEVINPGIGLNEFKHNAGWVIYERTQAQKNNIEKLARGKFIVFAEMKGKDADAFVVIGKDTGLEIVPGLLWNSQESGGFFTVNMSTAEGEFESKLPQTLGTTYANALVLIADLLAS